VYKRQPIDRIVRENARDVTIRLLTGDREPAPKPGQFFMVWVPDTDEIPLSISRIGPGFIELTVRPVGDATNRLATMRHGDYVGLRGPLGNSFTLSDGRVIVVGGGIGMAPLRPLVHILCSCSQHVTVLVAARTRDELLFVDEFSELKSSNEHLDLAVATDDGSSGFHGLATDLLKHILNRDQPDMIYTCGPEAMMYGVLQLALTYNVALEASLERYMKCGCGLCGSCALDNTGHLVCVDGPVFTQQELVLIEEFGKYTRDATGMRTAL